MDDYQIISRKYRPQRFCEVVGQSAIIQTLINSLKLGRSAQAYLFCGSKGTGKTTLARILAKALNCKSLGQDFEPCNQCISCVEITSSRSMDVIEIDGASNRGIDDIRKLNETVGYAPYSGKYKIIIIDEVHMLTKEAFNALLKTLEEPPRNTKFFFATTEPHKVLSTIMSRCQRFDLKRLTISAIKEKIKKVLESSGLQMEESALHCLAERSDGSLRDAESLLDQLICYGQNPITLQLLQDCFGLPAHQDLFALDEAIKTGKINFAFECVQKIFDSGKDLSVFMDALLEHFRHLLLLKLGKESSFLPETLREPYTKSAQHYTKEDCLYILDFLIEWQGHFSKCSSKQIALEMILTHLIRSRSRISIDSLVKRLCQLEAQPIKVQPVEKPPEEKPVQRYDMKAEAAQEEKIGSPQHIMLEECEAQASNVQGAAKSGLREAGNPAAGCRYSATQQSASLREQGSALDVKDYQIVHPSRYDTLIRFAAVELEGTIIK
ncbi:MAG TPA: DNA polymerase III subunit gamma/tau [Rhabdochlamydiaceae bacterium]|nr:DNA polymerase III subunit gamma/tau [Rhabdochlamydiaceae bacterium]